jgi:hypothetical protein
MFRERRAPQERCDQLLFSSKPGGVMSPPELNELTALVYADAAANASEKNEKKLLRNQARGYLMNRVSRN